MQHTTRRKALLVGAACGAALLGAAIAFREDLAFHYHTWRLDRALTVEDARPWLEKLEGHVQDPARAQRLVAMLGRQRPRLTFWVLQGHFIPPRGVGAVLVVRLGEFRHLARSLEERIRRDEDFLAVMAHFIRWNTVAWTLLSEHDPDSTVIPLLLTCAPAVQEGILRMSEVWLLTEAWLLGMSPLPPPLELSFPLSNADIDGLISHWKNLKEAWVQARRKRLRFDASLGRFVEVPAGQGYHDVPRPTEPLPGWTGPVPRVP